MFNKLSEFTLVSCFYIFRVMSNPFAALFGGKTSSQTQNVHEEVANLFRPGFASFADNFSLLPMKNLRVLGFSTLTSVNFDT